MKHPNLFPGFDGHDEGEPRNAPETRPRPSHPPFNFTDAMRPLMADIAATCEELQHIDMTRVAVTFTQARHGRSDGVQATMHPLRFEGGERRKTTRGRIYERPRVLVDGREALYVITYTLPRFLNLSLDGKLATIVHEMYHASPRFDGDLRRFAGGKPYHAGSQKRYDAVMHRIAQDYVQRTSRPGLHAFLRHTFAELVAAHGGIVGLRMRGLNPRRIG